MRETTSSGTTTRDYGRMALANTQPGHFKDYTLQLIHVFPEGRQFGIGARWYVKIAWGKISNGHQFQTKNFSTRSTAERFIRENLRKRLDHGYHVSDQPSLELEYGAF